MDTLIRKRPNLQVSSCDYVFVFCFFVSVKLLRSLNFLTIVPTHATTTALMFKPCTSIATAALFADVLNICRLSSILMLQQLLLHSNHQLRARAHCCVRIHFRPQHLQEKGVFVVRCHRGRVLRATPSYRQEQEAALVARRGQQRLPVTATPMDRLDLQTSAPCTYQNPQMAPTARILLDLSLPKF